jgi:two-component system, OmpR family, response regulator CpxR
MNRAPHVLLCDDDVELNALLREYLSLHGFTVTLVRSAEAALACLRQSQVAQSAIDKYPPHAAPSATTPNHETDHANRIDALVLDVMLPGMDGLAALREIRQSSNTDSAHANIPILMISGRGEPEDRVIGLELGADDYLSKPCLPRELLARLNALLRRGWNASVEHDVRKGEPEQSLLSTQRLQFGALSIALNQHRAYLADQELQLTGAEYQTLLELARQPTQFVSREQLTARCLHRPLERFDRAIDVHVCRLRRKLEGCALRIESARNAGYALIEHSALPS